MIMKVILDLSLKDIELLTQGLQLLQCNNDSETVFLKESFEKKEILDDEYKFCQRVLERMSDRLSNLITRLWK